MRSNIHGVHGEIPDKANSISCCYLSFNFLVQLRCTCSSFIDTNGLGKCHKRDKHFRGALSCFVIQPSSCKDLLNSTTIPKKQLSAEACKDENKGKS